MLKEMISDMMNPSARQTLDPAAGGAGGDHQRSDESHQEQQVAPAQTAAAPNKPASMWAPPRARAAMNILNAFQKSPHEKIETDKNRGGDQGLRACRPGQQTCESQARPTLFNPRNETGRERQALPDMPESTDARRPHQQPCGTR
jgi:hypothetical protein